MAARVAQWGRQEEASVPIGTGEAVLWAPQLVRLCRGWAGWGGHVRWEGTCGGGSLRGAETGQRASERAGGVSGVRRRVRLVQEVAQGSLAPTYRSPPTAEEAGKYRGQSSLPWGWFLGSMELSLWVRTLARPCAS